ncbi:4Fe-4S ferredoxin [Pigmentiphaga sp. NML030171]|uniref:4Fe-4S dicluster domain-containing protein n=1 Tax=Pigmentiphaga sp. NML030171 TaxID=2008676 RepID=UPI000B4185FE|nr:4Fe-4S binding protein [Pigmentiphaga sp. NML030171]OVZ66033.1 4Fe-4S ferredoxin [Pigmentiphaga sp. NML030171]
MPTLICDCNNTMPLDADALGAALDEKLVLHSTLCRHEAGAFQQAVTGTASVIVACTQEKRLFAQIGEHTEAAVAPVRFVNIRETGGWSREAPKATPKLAALLAAARLPDPEPVPTVSYRSAGRLLIVGPLDEAERAAAMLADTLDVTIFARGPGTADASQERRHPVLAGRLESLQGWLGAFDLAWVQDNPIDLDLCTRCNACLAACPEGAIGLDYQIDRARCRDHRACVAACTTAGAIDFARAPERQEARFDLVLELGGGTLFAQHAPPQGYFAWNGADPAPLLRLRELVGEFEKPKFFDYKQSLCAHSRNDTIGCRACVDICSALAIESDRARQQIKVNPNLCVGCGACTTACPTGAITYAYPRMTDQGAVLRTLLSTYARAGGQAPVLLVHSQEAGRAMVERLGRDASLGRLHGLPANVIPLGVWHTASLGLEAWLGAVALGASQVAILATAEEAPQYLDNLAAQLAVGQAILDGMGYAGPHLHLLRPDTPQALDAALRELAARRPGVPAAPARFAMVREKRSTLDLALDHLIAHAPAARDEIALPGGPPGTGSPLGGLAIDKDACTLCMSCVGACPSSALLDNPDAPQLRFLEKNCVQCGLCVETCPEDALALVPRLLSTPERTRPRVLNETAPYHCVRCSKPFGTQKAIEAMLARLSGHPMFQGAGLERLKMCGDCRVIDLYSGANETRITDL